jgi:hypothetical protein
MNIFNDYTILHSTVIRTTISFQNTWYTNRQRFPYRELRNKFATMKRMLFLTFKVVKIVFFSEEKKLKLDRDLHIWISACAVCK